MSQIRADDKQSRQATPKGGSPLEVFEDGERGKKLWRKLCEHFGIDPKAAQHRLGTGTQGEAYELADGRVLKLTWDEKEAQAAALVARTPDPAGNVVKITGVVRIKGYVQIWAIVMEKLQKIPAGDPFRIYADTWNEYSNSRSPPFNILPETIDGFIDEMESSYGFSDPEWQKFKQWIGEVAVYLESIGVEFHDFWHGNLMKRGSQYVVIDLGYSMSREHAPIDTIAKMLAMAKMLERR